MDRPLAWLSLALFLAFSNTAQPRPQFARSSPSSALPTPVGIWEADDGAGGAVGINLWNVSSSDGHGGPSRLGDKDPQEILQVGVYQRGPLKPRCGEENFYDMGWRGPSNGISSSYTQDKLIIHNPARIRGNIPLDLAIRHDPKTDSWMGRFHRGNFDRQLTLHRATDRPSHDQEICTEQSVMPRVPPYPLP